MRCNADFSQSSRLWWASGLHWKGRNRSSPSLWEYHWFCLASNEERQVDSLSWLSVVFRSIFRQDKPGSIVKPGHISSVGVPKTLYYWWAAISTDPRLFTDWKVFNNCPISESPASSGQPVTLRSSNVNSMMPQQARLERTFQQKWRQQTTYRCLLRNVEFLKALPALYTKAWQSKFEETFSVYRLKRGTEWIFTSCVYVLRGIPKHLANPKSAIFKVPAESISCQ